jgi:chemotaxis protein methyltransferase WspC
MKMIYKKIHKYLEDEIGLDIDSIGAAGIDRSIMSFMADHSITTTDELIFELRSSAALSSLLLERIIVPETWFFRDTKPFEYLELWLQQNKDLYKNDMLRILSAPCSTGEEPYSIAIALTEAGLTKDRFQIDAIDISEESIKKAKKGEYHKVSFRSDDKYYMNKYFISKEINRFQLSDEIKSMVNFRKDNILNLMTIKPFEKYHIVFFKNLLIYLTPASRLRVMQKIKQLLHQRGVLFTGHSESSFFLQHGFSVVNFPHSFALTLSTDSPLLSKEKVINTIQSKSNIRTVRKQFVVKDSNGTSGKETQRIAPIIPEKKEEVGIIQKIKALADKGHFEKALEMCIDYSQKNKTDSDCYFLQGLIFEGMDDKENAIIQYNKALYLSPSHVDALLHLSLLYESIGQKKQARSLKDRLSRIMKNTNETN